MCELQTTDAVLALAPRTVSYKSRTTSSYLEMLQGQRGVRRTHVGGTHGHQERTTHTKREICEERQPCDERETHVDREARVLFPEISRARIEDTHIDRKEKDGTQLQVRLFP